MHLNHFYVCERSRSRHVFSNKKSTLLLMHSIHYAWDIHHDQIMDYIKKIIFTFEIIFRLKLIDTITACTEFVIILQASACNLHVRLCDYFIALQQLFWLMRTAMNMPLMHCAFIGTYCISQVNWHTCYGAFILAKSTMLWLYTNNIIVVQSCWRPVLFIYYLFLSLCMLCCRWFHDGDHSTCAVKRGISLL